MQSLEQQIERVQPRVDEVCACLHEHFCFVRQQEAGEMHSQSEEEESARRTEHIEQLFTEIEDILHEGAHGA